MKGVAAVSLAGMTGGLQGASSPAVSPAMPSAARLPRWRGFNLLEKFIAAIRNAPFEEADFALMAEWGFNFARLPLSYLCWSSPAKWREIDERVLREIDQAVSWGRQYGIHICLNFHRAPGYSVDSSVREPFNLWTDAEALEACAHHWRHFAARYRHIPSSELSFNLLNEPALLSPDGPDFVSDAANFKVVEALVKVIREESPDRLIIADGLVWGNIPSPALVPLGVAQSTRGYQPHELTHLKAEWVAGSEHWPLPAWPLQPRLQGPEEKAQTKALFDKAFSANPIVRSRFDKLDQNAVWNKERLQRQMIEPWKDLEALGVGIHVGEFGVYNKTPHDVTLAWMKDVLSCWKDAGWGWALWNLRGDFGVLDSGRTDVVYENFKGHKLDRQMLELLRQS